MKLDLDLFYNLPTMSMEFISKNKEIILAGAALVAIGFLSEYFQRKQNPEAIPFLNREKWLSPTKPDKYLHNYSTISHKIYPTPPQIFEVVPKQTEHKNQPVPLKEEKAPCPIFTPDIRGMLKQTDPCFYGAGFNDWSVPALD
jgi:hypothetical protein